MFATLDDVSTRLGRPITDQSEVDQVNAWIGDAESLILARVPDLVPGAPGFPSLGVVSMVVANAVIRKVRNPDGKVSEAIDDYNYRYNENARKGDLFFTDEEWALLVPAATSGAFTVTPFFVGPAEGTWVHGDTWVPAP